MTYKSIFVASLGFLSLAVTTVLRPVSAFDDKNTNDALNGAVGYVIVNSIDNKDKPATGFGSCVHLISPGWFVTNAHVTPGANHTVNTVQIVIFPGTKAESTAMARVVAVHPDQDLALLKCDLADEVPVLTAGGLDGVTLRSEATSIGYPFGNLAEPDRGNPSVMISAGQISGLRRDADERLVAIATTAPTWGGSSGGALVDSNGQLIGINTWKVGSFSRAIPVSFVNELMGIAALNVTLDPPVAGDADKVRVLVSNTGPAAKLTSGQLLIPGSRVKSVKLRAVADGLSGDIRVRDLGARGDCHDASIVIESTDTAGQLFRRAVWVPLNDKASQPYHAQVHWIKLKELKSNGWPWDTPWDGPDIFSRIYVNDVLLKETETVWGQHRSFPGEVLELKSRDRVRIDVFDNDVKNNDAAGSIRFTVGDTELVQRPANGEIDSCYITVRPVPPRPRIDQ